MNRWVSNTLGIVLIAAVASGIYGAWGGWHQILVAVDHWGNAAPDLKPTLATLNRPCGISNVKSSANYSTFYSEGSLMPCGTLAEIATSVVKAGDAVVQTQLIEHGTTQHVTAAMDQFGMAAQHLSGTADSLKGAADALTGTAQGATDTLAEGKRTIAAAQPVMANLAASSADLDTFLKGKMLTETLPAIALNLQTTTGNFAATTADVRSQVYKWTHPSKKKLTFWTATEAGGDYARHFMPPLF